MKNLTGVFFLFLFVQLTVAAPESESQKYWIFFIDKGNPSTLKKARHAVLDHMTARARQRRLKVLDPQALVEITDLPLYTPYKDSLVAHGIDLVYESKWFNAVSAYLTQWQRLRLLQKEFVREIRPVKIFYRSAPENGGMSKTPAVVTAGDEIDPRYGYSYTQNSLSQIPQVHDLGFSGEDVLIAVFDSGFRLNHNAFAQLDVVAMYDFIHKDNNVDYDAEQDIVSQISHGTKVLSVIAGYHVNHLIGPAYNSRYLLAKTEDVSSETRIEEDFWIAAAEWADSLGADIITASVGYNDWYTYADMDGNTAMITKAADLAVKKGIVVVSSAGNERNNSWKYVIAPADGDSVIAAGAVDQNKTVTYFSSSGPTADGRVKPDVMAMGQDVYSINVPIHTDSTSDRYTYISGTSASAPIVAGACALILTAHPDLTPMQVREALIQTANRADRPDNDYGYGLVQTLEALYYHGDPHGIPSRTDFAGGYPNPVFRDQGRAFTLLLDIQSPARVSIEVYNRLGQQILSLYNGTMHVGGNQAVRWDCLDNNGRPVASGIYFIRIRIASKEIIHKVTVL